MSWKLRSDSDMSKRKRKRIKVSRVKLPSTIATPSDYIYHLETDYKKHPDMVAILYCRVSHRSQKEHLTTYENILRTELKRLGVPVLDCYSEIVSGWEFNRYKLKMAVSKAQDDPRAVILATSTDRFLRASKYKKEKPDTLPTVADFESLLEETGDVPLLTLLNPDMSPRKAHTMEIKWGKEANGKVNVGRPKKKKPGYKKKHRQLNIERARELYDSGVSIRDIGSELETPSSTVHGWLNRRLK